MLPCLSKYENEWLLTAQVANRGAKNNVASNKDPTADEALISAWPFKEHTVPLSCSSSLIINLCHVSPGGRFPLKCSSPTGVVVLYDSIMSHPQKPKLLQKSSRASDSCASIIQSPWMDKINMKSLRWASLSFHVSGTFFLPHGCLFHCWTLI